MIQYPNYDESLISVTSSLLRYYGIDNDIHPSLKELDRILNNRKPQNIVLMLFDGFGYNIMLRNLPKESFLRKHIVRSISSTFPPTTVAATTAVLSGRSPKETGWLGWFTYYPEIDDIVTTFTNLRRSNHEFIGKNLSAKYIPYIPFGKKIEEHNPNVLYTELTPYSEAHINSLSMMEKSLTNLLSNGKRNIVYCYSPEPDYSMHEFGVNDIQVIKTEHKIDSFVEKLTSSANANTLFIIIADHGLIDAKYIYFADYPELNSMLARAFSMECRAASLFIKEGMQDSFKNLFEKLFDEHFILYDRKTFLESGLLGPGAMHHMVNDFVGDFVSVSKDEYCLEMEKSESELIGVHAGLTQDEMLVPLIVV